MTKFFKYAQSRTASPALLDRYQTQPPDNALLQAEPHEFYLQNTAVRNEAQNERQPSEADLEHSPLQSRKTGHWS